MTAARFKADGARMAGLWRLVSAGRKWYSVVLLLLLALYGSMLYFGWVFYRELGIVTWKGGRLLVKRAARLPWHRLSLPRFGSKEVNMTGSQTQAGSYDKNGLPW